MAAANEIWVLAFSQDEPDIGAIIDNIQNKSGTVEPVSKHHPGLIGVINAGKFHPTPTMVVNGGKEFVWLYETPEVIKQHQWLKPVLGHVHDYYTFLYAGDGKKLYPWKKSLTRLLKVEPTIDAFYSVDLPTCQGDITLYCYSMLLYPWA